jgi:L,D-transpeptidase catalytic domain
MQTVTTIGFDIAKSVFHAVGQVVIRRQLRVSKSESHGCVRMTNWDVERLAKSVRKGVEVSFIEGKQASR